MSVPKSIFEGNFITYVFGKCLFLALSSAEKRLLVIATFISRKAILNYFVFVEV
jgi:hypothetical protein